MLLLNRNVELSEREKWNKARKNFNSLHFLQQSVHLCIFLSYLFCIKLKWACINCIYLFNYSSSYSISSSSSSSSLIYCCVSVHSLLFLFRTTAQQLSFRNWTIYFIFMRTILSLTRSPFSCVLDSIVNSHCNVNYMSNAYKCFPFIFNKESSIF
jgi:hypothetical protein